MHEKLNILSREHVKLKSGDTFNALYKAAKEALYKMHVATVCNNPNCREEDALASFDDTFLKLADKITEEDDFIMLLSRALKRDRHDLFKIRRRHTSRFELKIDAEVVTEDSAPTLTVTDPTTPELTFFYKKREDEQRQLIAHLLDPSQVDATTIQLAEAYLADTDFNLSDLQIAKSIGVHHETAKRKLRKLIRRFDANRFGDIQEYVAV